jgi:methionyl-tRNA formyltransferase
MDGDAETGITIMQMDAGLDTGAILSQSTTPISPNDTAQSLHDRLAAMGAELLVQTIPRFLNGDIQPRPQPEQGISYARKISKEDGRLDWRQPARVLGNRLRAFTPWPGSFGFLPGMPKPLLVKVWIAEVVPGGNPAPGTILAVDADGITVACGQEALRIRELQREGKRRMTTREFLAGYPLRAGDSFV